MGKKLATLMAALASIGISHSAAWGAPSAGCAALVGTFGVSPAGAMGDVANFGIPGPIVAGEALTVTEVGVANSTWQLEVPAGGSVVVASQSSATSLTYTFVGGEGSFSVRNTGANGITFTIACTEAAAAGSSVSDSQKLRAVQVSGSNLVAHTSGQAITNAIDQGTANGFGNGGTPASFGPNGGFVSFTAEPRSPTPSQLAQNAFAALGYAPNNINKAPPRLDRQWSLWADIRGTGWKVNETTGTGNDLKGNQINITAGLGRKLNPDTLVGVVAGYENFKYDVAALTGSLKGHGESAGGYVARHFGSSLRFNAALVWSHLNYSATAGTASGSFIGSRWLASAGLTGSHRLGAFLLEPSAKFYMLWEHQRAWTDSLGTLQASRNFSAGRTALGGKVAYPFTTSGGWTLTPYAGVYGDWRFATANALPTGTLVGNIGTGWSGRVTTGVSANAESGASVSLGGEYGGLGANYKLWSANARGTVPF